jgi:hypothetical protein
MKTFAATLMKIAGYLFAGLLLAFTAYETYSLLLAVTASPLIAAVGLVMFEGGFLYWAAEFKSSAEGLLQMAVALLTSIADFLAVVAAVALRLGAVDQSLLGPATGSKLVVLAVLINLAAKYAFTLAHPDTLKAIYQRAAEGVILSRTFAAFDGKTKEIAANLADSMADNWRDQLAGDLAYRHSSLTRRPPALPAPTDPKPEPVLSANGDGGDHRPN